MKTYSELTKEEKVLIVKACETSTQKKVAAEFNIAIHTVGQVMEKFTDSIIFVHQKNKRGMVKNNFIKITLKDRTVIKGTYTGETAEAVKIIQENFSFETEVLKEKIKHRETIVPYIEPTELELLKVDEEKLIERLIENRRRQMKIQNEKTATASN